MPSDVTVTIFTDPGCPFGFNAQRQDLQLRWTYGEHADVRVRMIVLKSRPLEFEPGGALSPAKLVANGKALRDEHGMPMAVPTPTRLAATRPACKAVVGARLDGGEPAGDRLLRAIRVRVHSAGETIDEPATLLAAAADAGVAAATLRGWLESDAVEAELVEEMAAARAPVPEALALPHKLAREGDDGWRYTASSTIVESGERRAAAPGFQPWAAYEVAFAAGAPQLPRRAPPETPEELLAWAPYPLATAEVAAVRGISIKRARAELEASAATLTPYANDGYWALP
jgi:predicted DsbA family dithiol-disulfide isomerase